MALNIPYGSNGAFELSPDTFPNNGSFSQVTGINATGSLTEILSLSGRFALIGIWFSGLTSADMSKIKLTIDGVDIFNEDPFTSPSGTSWGLIGGTNQTTGRSGEAYIINNSLSLSVQMATDTDISLQYLVRAIK